MSLLFSDESQQKFLLENLKTSVLLYSRKKNIRSRFGAAKMTSTSSGACSTNESGALIQSVLDLLPGYDPNLIKVIKK